MNDQPATGLGTDAAASDSDAARWVRAAVDQYEGPLIQYATRLLAGDVERAREVVQDTFLKLWTAERAAVDGHLAPWLYRVCRNGALDVRRKEARMSSLEQEQMIEGRETPSGDRGAAASSAEFRNVWAVLESLPERQQEVLRLKFQGNLSYREIAGVMELTVNHVGVLIHNALKTIRERMTAKENLVDATGLGGIAGQVQGVSQTP